MVIRIYCYSVSTEENNICSSFVKCYLFKCYDYGAFCVEEL